MSFPAIFRALCLASCVAVCGSLAAFAAGTPPAPFDLSGPTIEVKVTRGTATLPASEVPNLAPGDRLWIKADLPSNQSVHYLLVAAFLRGSTNPPPESWFFPCKTWSGKCATEGMTITVPQDAQQILLLMAPQSSGDFRTLMGAVRGRPGAFVRTSQDLHQAALDRSRLERYLATLRDLNAGDPARLAQVAPLLARSLGIKVDDKCLDKLPQLQAPCLMMGQESLILTDGHSTSIVEALTSGPGGDLAMEASYTPQAGYGYYSPYIASVLDIARIFDSFGTAQYQYIPALATPRGDALALTLNTAPSFHNPKSVLVAALPPVEQPQLPPLHAVNPAEIYCARKTQLVLPVDGAPLVFATAFAHDVMLTLTGANGRSLSLPATADPAQGGYVVDTAALGPANLGDTIQGSLRGYWGFDAYEGPRFHLMNAQAGQWQLAGGDEASLIVGRQDTVHLRAASVSCVDAIMLQDPAGKQLKVDWKPVKADEVEIKLPLQEARPGELTLMVTQYGLPEPQPVTLQAFAEAGRFDGFTFHLGDNQGVLKGSRLDEVASLTLKSLTFLPGELSSAGGVDQLPMIAAEPQAAAQLSALAKGVHTLPATVTLRDGRTVTVGAGVEPPRPRVSLIGKNVLQSAAAAASNIRLVDAAELPQDDVLTFSLRSQAPATFSHDEEIEVATGDESAATVLNVQNGGLTLENSQVAVATLSPAKAFGPSTFGPLKFRARLKGVLGDWQPLAHLVRLPTLTELTCPAAPELACKLAGSNLFFIDSVAAEPHAAGVTPVPDGFVGAALNVPHPGAAGLLYLRLRDDPQIANSIALTPQMPRAPEPAPAAAAPAQPTAPAPSAAPTRSPAPAPSAAPTASSEPVPTS